MKLKKTDIVYLAGPMSGKPLLNYVKFYGLANLIEREYGCKVLNPARHPHGLKYEDYLNLAMKDIAECTVIVMFIGWPKSKGAQREYEESKRLGKRNLHERDITRELHARYTIQNPTLEIGDVK